MLMGGELKSQLAQEDGLCMCMHIFKIYQIYFMPQILIIWIKRRDENCVQLYRAANINMWTGAKCLGLRPTSISR